MEEKLFLLRYGEIGLKGKNRVRFEKILIERIKNALAPFGKGKFHYTRGRLFVSAQGNESEILQRLQKVFGIVSISPAIKTGLDLEEIKAESIVLLKKSLIKGDKKTFRVKARRANKVFPYTSMELNYILGEYILSTTEGMSVDLANPDISLGVEVRDSAYIYTEILPGSGGLPLGSSGKAAVLLSGGIDSPVAAWMVMKRGMEIVPVYFHSFPFTGDKTKEKVIDLCRVLAMYGEEIKLHVVHFTEIQKEIVANCPEELTTILMRRMMMRLTEKIAYREGALSLVTGESIGQVASQTPEALLATNSVVDLTVFRPLIGLDKVEIIDKANNIGTYNISIRPYDDCCTLFVPRHPNTKPKIEALTKAEKLLPSEDLMEQALEKTEVIKVSNK